MDPKVVLVLTWIVAGLVVAAYIWFVVWRYRVERRKKAAQALTDDAMSDAIARATQRAAAVAEAEGKPVPATTPTPDPIAAPVAPIGSARSTAPPRVEPERPAPEFTASATAPPPRRGGETTVAALLSGISLPHDLVPLTTMAVRSNTADRVAFWTDRAPVEVVGPAFADELERLGYTVNALDPKSLAAVRGEDHLMVVIHPDGRAATVDGQVGFSSVPEHAVVIEVWVPS